MNTVGGRVGTSNGLDTSIGPEKADEDVLVVSPFVLVGGPRNCCTALAQRDGSRLHLIVGLEWHALDGCALAEHDGRTQLYGAICKYIAWVGGIVIALFTLIPAFKQIGLSREQMELSREQMVLLREQMELSRKQHQKDIESRRPYLAIVESTGVPGTEEAIRFKFGVQNTGERKAEGLVLYMYGIPGNYAHQRKRPRNQVLVPSPVLPGGEIVKLHFEFTPSATHPESFVVVHLAYQDPDHEGGWLGETYYYQVTNEGDKYVVESDLTPETVQKIRDYLIDEDLLYPEPRRITRFTPYRKVPAEQSEPTPPGSLPDATPTPDATPRT